MRNATINTYRNVLGFNQDRVVVTGNRVCAVAITRPLSLGQALLAALVALFGVKRAKRAAAASWAGSSRTMRPLDSAMPRGWRHRHMAPPASATTC